MPFPPFPYTAVIDNFDRADVGPPISSAATPSGLFWQTGRSIAGSGNEFAISSNQAAAVADATVTNQVIGPFAADQEAYVTVATLPGGSNSAGLWLRCNFAAAFTGYRFHWNGTVFFIFKFTNSSPTLLTSLAGSLSAGDSIGASAVGSRLSLYKKAVGGSWPSTPILTVVDTSFPDPGYIGMMAVQSTVRLDDFGGGTGIYPQQSQTPMSISPALRC